MMIDSEKMNWLENTPLSSGAHESITYGACAMEAVSYIAGEPWSDHPECVCPVIAEFLRAWNDTLPDADRTQLLRPFVTRVIGTRSTPAVEHRRSLMALDWLVREYTPAWLELVTDLQQHADALRALPQITDDNAADVGDRVRAAWDAAGDAAGDAARAAAWVRAAQDAAWDAAWGAAGDAARAAAWDAAWVRAARAAAWDALRDTVERLQKSAVILVEAMIAIEGDE